MTYYYLNAHFRGQRVNERQIGNNLAGGVCGIIDLFLPVFAWTD